MHICDIHEMYCRPHHDHHACQLFHVVLPGLAYVGFSPHEHQAEVNLPPPIHCCIISQPTQVMITFLLLLSFCSHSDAKQKRDLRVKLARTEPVQTDQLKAADIIDFPETWQNSHEAYGPAKGRM